VVKRSKTNLPTAMSVKPVSFPSPPVSLDTNAGNAGNAVDNEGAHKIKSRMPSVDCHMLLLQAMKARLELFRRSMITFHLMMDTAHLSCHRSQLLQLLTRILHHRRKKVSAHQHVLMICLLGGIWFRLGENCFGVSCFSSTHNSLMIVPPGDDDDDDDDDDEGDEGDEDSATKQGTSTKLHRQNSHPKIVLSKHFPHDLARRRR
jgi:hypothetical protein